ncbi:proton extrusion protein PcxA [Thermostichus vulcanus]|uniref:Proton extrusion protein PxcA n=1 Tax=Thermostichus vulcanus str. 'Rupite' TaxID=2813851 RepID=A0ABT0CA36_THEVL|nr:proton extrusion protein PcxA [Thermostichus vulcanus]MCJ2542649.1 proton extrusion protein PcxA [Thermostichus vulcanus str. 'Rupite']
MGESVFSRLGQWISNTPLRSLEQAYEAALRIKAIEDQHFHGQSIRSDGEHGQNVSRYFQIQLRQQLSQIELRLAEFRASSTFSRLPDPSRNGSGPIASSGQGAQDQDKEPHPSDPVSNDKSPENGRQSRDPSILEKLQFIDQVLSRYKRPPGKPKSIAAPLESPDQPQQLAPTQPTPSDKGDKTSPNNGNAPVASKMGILPRSILRTASQIRRELSSQAEEELIRDYRNSRNRTLVSVRFLLLLAILPLLTQILSKNFLFGPLIDHLQYQNPTAITLSQEFQEKALSEFEFFKEKIEFERALRHQSPELDLEAEDQLSAKAEELLQKYGRKNSEGIKNVFADLLSLVVFGWLIFIGREEIEVLKSFLDRLIYGLSDSAKAFIIILFTDIFVGYHSPHGWEVLLSNLAAHLGVPENRDLVYGFIATFPVFLDTVFKYWIFRYLNRVSPSSVATYRAMND